MKFNIKNCIYIVLFVSIEAVIIVQVINRGTVDILTIIGFLVLGAIGYVGFLEILFLFRLTFLLPQFYIDACKNICVNSEINKVASSSIENIAALLKLSINEFKLLQSIKEEELHSFVQIKSSEPTAKRIIEGRLIAMLKNPMIIIDSRNLKSTSMSEIDYYINFLDIMYNSRFSEDIILTMCSFIKLKLEPIRLSKISYIIIPYDSNILFGAGVARILNKKAIKVLREIPDYHIDKHWEGYIDEFNEENSIIIHDTLYTGRQVLESCKILHKYLNKTEKENFPHLLFFSLCARKSNELGKNGLKILRESGFEVHSILEIDDQYINKIRSE